MNMEYLKNIRRLLDHVEQNMTTEIDRIAEVCANAIQNDGLLYFFGTGHSHMVCEEPFYRAGGFANIYPLLAPPLMLHESASESSMIEREQGIGARIVEESTIRSGDVIFLISNSGRNAACIDAELLSRISGKELQPEKDPNQRAACGCAPSALT